MRISILILIFVVQSSLWATDKIQIGGTTVLNPIPGSTAVDHDTSFHTGVDVILIPGATVNSPLEGVFTDTVQDTVTHSKWGGMVIEGTGADLGTKVRMIGITPSVKKGSAIAKNAEIGRVQNPDDYFKKMTPYIHVEVYAKGKRINGSPWIKARWKGVKYVTPNDEIVIPRNNIASVADEQYRLGGTKKALENYQAAMKLPTFETNSFLEDHRVALLLAKSGKFKEAEKVQEPMLKRLKAELRYAEGNFPEPILGITASARSEISLKIMTEHQMANLVDLRKGKLPEFEY